MAANISKVGETKEETGGGYDRSDIKMTETVNQSRTGKEVKYIHFCLILFSSSITVKLKTIVIKDMEDKHGRYLASNSPVG